MINKTLLTLCMALSVSPMMVLAGGPGAGGVLDQIVESPQDDDAPIVGSLNPGLVAGGVLAALLLAAAASGSTSSTTTTN